MKVLFLGDVVGRAGRKAIAAHLPGLRKELALDCVICNAENMAGGFGVTPSTVQNLYDSGVDIITLGNHSFDNPQGISIIENDEKILRPVNYPPGTAPGRGVGLYEIGNFRIMVINVLGRVFMDSLDDPFVAVGKELEAAPLGAVADFIMVDVHAEATSEKQGMGYFCDGRASLVAGTHTHTPTSDTRILPGGTGFQTDAGMCGDYNSIIGMDIQEPLHRFTTRMRSARFEPATGEGTVSGVYVETSADGLAVDVRPIRRGGVLSQS